VVVTGYMGAYVTRKRSESLVISGEVGNSAGENL